MTTKIEITVPVRRNQERRRVRNKGSVIPSRQSDDLGRRRTGAGLIRFYDLGYLSNGTTRSTGILFDDFDPPAEGGAELRNFYNWPLSVDRANWPNTFQKITAVQPGYKFHVALSKDGDPVNAGSEQIESTNPKWTEKGYKIDRPFNEISLSDPNYLLAIFSSSSSPSSKRTTTAPASTSPDVPIPALDPKRGPIDVYLSPAVLKVDAAEPIPPPEGGPPSVPTPTSHPQGYNLITPACPALTSPGVPPEWEVALVTTSAFSDSGSARSAKSQFAAALDREGAFISPLNASEFQSLSGDVLNYLDRAMAFNYVVTSYSRAGRYLSYTAKEHGSFPAFYIGRNYLCYGGQTHSAQNGDGAATIFSTNSSSSSPSGPFIFTNSFAGNANGLVDLIPSNNETGEGGALLAVINQGENWYYIWHVNRYFIP